MSFYSKTLPVELVLLTAAIETNEIETARKILHKIIPSIDHLGIPQLSDQRKELHDLTEAMEPLSMWKSKFSGFISKVRLSLT
jgi:hypothetical protein